MTGSKDTTSRTDCQAAAYQATKTEFFKELEWPGEGCMRTQQIGFLKLKLSWQIWLNCLIFLPILPNLPKLKIP